MIDHPRAGLTLIERCETHQGAQVSACLQCEVEALRRERDELRKDAERYREWRRAFRDGECGLYNALCDAGSEAEHDAAIDAALQERKS